MSLPVRGAWVEIWCGSGSLCEGGRRSPCGERGLKFVEVCITDRKRGRRSPCGERGLKSAAAMASGKHCPRRSPCGERGLKFFTHLLVRCKGLSLPVRGAWVEMPFRRLVRPSAGESLPVRGAWVEIERCAMALRYSAVAPRAGSVG